MYRLSIVPDERESRPAPKSSPAILKVDATEPEWMPSIQKRYPAVKPGAACSEARAGFHQADAWEEADAVAAAPMASGLASISSLRKDSAVSPGAAFKDDGTAGSRRRSIGKRYRSRPI